MQPDNRGIILDYYGTKRIKAYVCDKDDQPGYAVIYADGYESWSPKEPFEDAYRKSGHMNFGHALAALKNGKKVSRKGWNGSGQFVYYVPPASYKAQTDVARAVFGDTVPYRAYLALKTVQNDIAFWVPSISDLLAEDWEVIE